MPRRVFITVAEVSGDQHAAGLIRALRSLDPEIIVEGIGGSAMADAGATIIHESVGKAAMGWRGAMRAFEILPLITRVRARYEQQKPSLHICIDSSAMNIPFAKMAKSMKVPVLYYIAPQLWASREGRMKKLRAYVDKVACILPFEEAYFRGHGIDAKFVGHPLFDQLPANRDRNSDGAHFPDRPPIIGIIPGSRNAEVRSNLPPLMEVAERIKSAFPRAQFLIPTTEAVDSMVRKIARGRASIKVNAFDELIQKCDLCLCKSGTSTLHVAAWSVPMIVVYRASPILGWFAKTFLLKTQRVALVNILSDDKDLVPEFVPWHGSNEPVAALALGMLGDPRLLDDQRSRLRKLISTIERPGASNEVAHLALGMMK